jgi:hypothetical protein
MLESVEDHTEVNRPYSCSATNVKGTIEMHNGRKSQLLVQ